VIKRISLLVTAALLVATMAMAGLAGPAFADPNCEEVPNNKNCVTTVTGPGNSENSQGQAVNKNKNVKEETTFKGRPQ
jgi:hypothetical protein